jgi:uncharacterized membrane protein
MPQTQIQEHIDLIARHEQEFLAQRTSAERLSDAIASLVGSLLFVALNLFVSIAWIAWNLAPRLDHFDPAPFSLLGTILALEAILTASFILMRQARTSRRSDERDHLMLQVLLLSEKEITALLQINRQSANHLGLNREANNPELRELSQHTSIDDVAQTIKENLPTQG